MRAFTLHDVWCSLTLSWWTHASTLMKSSTALLHLYRRLVLLLCTSSTTELRCSCVSVNDCMDSFSWTVPCLLAWEPCYREVCSYSCPQEASSRTLLMGCCLLYALCFSSSWRDGHRPLGSAFGAEPGLRQPLVSHTSHVSCFCVGAEKEQRRAVDNDRFWGKAEAAANGFTPQNALQG